MTTGIGGSTPERQLSEIAPFTERPPGISKDERRRRIENARAAMARAGANAMIIGAGASMRYFSGVSFGPSERLIAMALTAKGDPFIICPAFEKSALEKSLEIDAAIHVWQEHENPFELAGQLLKAQGAKTLAVDPEIAFWMVEALRKEGAGADIAAASGIIDACRSVKSDAEIALMQYAKSITLEVHRRAARILTPGISTDDVTDFIHAAHKAYGAPGSAFCIALFGEATSHPHGVPGAQHLREGDVVLIDTGCAIEGYHSDITRTYVFGTPSRKQRDIWDLEKAAQAAAFDAAVPGAPCETVDAAARKRLEQGGLGPDYALPGLPHRTGHGIGLSIHEAPYLVRGDKTPLAPGMCFSNEPMIVVPGEFGVRLEDHFYMTPSGPRWFTKPSHSIDAPFG